MAIGGGFNFASVRLPKTWRLGRRAAPGDGSSITGVLSDYYDAEWDAASDNEDNDQAVQSSSPYACQLTSFDGSLATQERDLDFWSGFNFSFPGCRDAEEEDTYDLAERRIEDRAALVKRGVLPLSSYATDVGVTPGPGTMYHSHLHHGNHKALKTRDRVLNLHDSPGGAPTPAPSSLFSRAMKALRAVRSSVVVKPYDPYALLYPVGRRPPDIYTWNLRKTEPPWKLKLRAQAANLGAALIAKISSKDIPNHSVLSLWVAIAPPGIKIKAEDQGNLLSQADIPRLNRAGGESAPVTPSAIRESIRVAFALRTLSAGPELISSYQSNQGQIVSSYQSNQGQSISTWGAAAEVFQGLDSEGPRHVDEEGLDGTESEVQEAPSLQATVETPRRSRGMLFVLIKCCVYWPVLTVLRLGTYLAVKTFEAHLIAFVVLTALDAYFKGNLRL
ncbi:hypothetical protein BKA70DRAFT_1234454 [Coprinopsis sp. MPI-PUGE-AT-0042]|nr:hypothetical protein BKA70DRAFT_1234454 [Coprinopsis sp. MPI-PUGE-AT-0042]